MKTKNTYIKYRKVRTLCLKNAGDLIKAANQIADKNLQHIQFHLSTLALEEIGKGELIEMASIAKLNHRDTVFEESSMENHIRKLYWAFWGPSFSKKVMTKKEIEDLQGLAKSIHLKRLDTLYVKSDDSSEPKNKVSQNEANEIMKLAEVRLAMEKGKKMLNPDDPTINKEELTWFLNSSSDPEKFKLIFGTKSQEKLIEIGNVRDWVHWLKEQFDQNDAEIKKMIEDEYNRKKPVGDDAVKPKYRIKIRINSESHSIRNKELKKWNDSIEFIKLYSDNKSDLICDFFLPKSIHVQSTWHIGWGMARTFVTSLNIATRGFFWWHVPKDRSRFYEDMWDLERNVRMGAEQKPALTVNFKDLHWVLKDRDLMSTSMIFHYITKVKDKEEGIPFNDYVLGLSFLAKNDIHLRFELNAYAQFYQSFKNAFRISCDWDGKVDFKEAVHKQFSKLGNFKSLDDYLDWGNEQELSPDKKPSKELTLTEVFGMKLFADIYLEILAKRYVDFEKNKK